MNRFLNWLFPDRINTTAKCSWCGARRHKTRMISEFGVWYCDENHANCDFWDNQW